MDGAGDNPLAARDPREGTAAHGRAIPRGQAVDARRGVPGRRFGWMFQAPDEERRQRVDATEELVDWMDKDKRSRRSDNTAIPAGFTYLGQFIDHDITFDPMSKLDRPNEPDSLVNFRTPRLDLDSLYGSGPQDQPFLYDWKRSRPPGKKLLVAHNSPDAMVGGEPLASQDLPRNHEGRALIGDPRNDENVILTQLHLLFIRFHNAVVDRLLAAGQVAADDLFDEAQRIVRWHYQWIVVNEFLPMVAGRETVKSAIARREHYTPGDEPFIPFEFSLAAFRFGHSMVRSDYVMQRRHPRGTPLFPDMAGFRWLPERLVIDWELFFELPGANGVRPQSSQLINTTIVRPLWSLPETGEALARLTLRRGRKIGLPSGQEVAAAMEVQPLTAADLPFAKLAGKAGNALGEQTPLWFYILSEAERDGSDGERLGPVGGRIVAEVLIGLLVADPQSYLSRQPDWQPDLGAGGAFAMADLVRIAQGVPLA
jgi:Animal haem peroxidase